MTTHPVHYKAYSTFLAQISLMLPTYRENPLFRQSLLHDNMSDKSECRVMICSSERSHIGWLINHYRQHVGVSGMNEPVEIFRKLFMLSDC